MNHQAHVPGRGVMSRVLPPRGSGRIMTGIALAAGFALLAAGCGNSPSVHSGSPPPSSQHSYPSPSGTGGLLSPPTGVQTVSPSRETMGTGSKSGVSGGVLFGGDIPLAQEASKLGRRLAVVRQYYRIGMKFPNAEGKRLMASGSTLVVSLDATPAETYASIAAGQEDGPIRTFLRSVERAAVHYKLGAIYMCFEHEANTALHAGLGRPAEFVRAWDHVHQLAVSMGLDWNQGGRIHWIFILTAGAFITGVAGRYWPGSNEVDIVASDGYNTAGCRADSPGNLVASTTKKEVSPSYLFGPAVGFAHAVGGLPVFITEWGSVPYISSGVQPGFIHQMQAYASGNREIAAVMYWDAHGHGNACNYEIDHRPESLAALSAMAHSPAFQGHISPAG